MHLSSYSSVSSLDVEMSITWEIVTRLVSNNQSDGIIHSGDGGDAALMGKTCHCWELSLSFFLVGCR